MGLEETLRRIRAENQQHREKFDGLVSRAVSSIGSGNYGDVNTILAELTDVRGQGEEDSPETVATGDIDGTSGAPVTAITPITE